MELLLAGSKFLMRGYRHHGSCITCTWSHGFGGISEDSTWLENDVACLLTIRLNVEANYIICQSYLNFSLQSDISVMQIFSLKALLKTQITCISPIYQSKKKSQLKLLLF